MLRTTVKYGTLGGITSILTTRTWPTLPLSKASPQVKVGILLHIVPDPLCLHFDAIEGFLLHESPSVTVTVININVTRDCHNYELANGVKIIEPAWEKCKGPNLDSRPNHRASVGKIYRAEISALQI